MQRSEPWSLLTDKFEEPLPFKEALAAGNLDYEVALADLDISYSGRTELVEGFNAVVRTDTLKTLGVVAGAYSPVSNHIALGVIEDIGDVSYAWQTHGGARAGMAVQLDGITAGGIEELALWLEVTTGHDGKHALQFRPVILQLACLNQLPPMVGEFFNKMRHRVIHTFSALDRAGNAATAIQMAEDTLKQANSAIETLLDVEIGLEDMEDLLTRAGKATELPTSAQAKCVAQITSLHDSSSTLHPEARNTGWGLMHAATEYWTHTRAHRSKSSAWAACNAPRGVGKLYCNKLTRELKSLAA